MWGERASCRQVHGPVTWSATSKPPPSVLVLSRPGPESDYHLQVPYEFHADTSPLVQLLKKGHYNVKLDAEAWDRLITWIDLNVLPKAAPVPTAPDILPTAARHRTCCSRSL